MASAFLTSFFMFPSCTQEKESDRDRKIRTVSQSENKGIRAVSNKGRMNTWNDKDTLYIYFNDSLKDRVKTIRIYDQNGSLKYLGKDSEMHNSNVFKLNCTYFRDGAYLILAYLDTDELIEETIVLE